MMNTDGKLRREEAFHNEWADSTALADVDVDAVYNSPTALELRYIVAAVGGVKGKKVLEVGCGLGEASVVFAKQGAEVTATDISPQMVAFTQRLARAHGVVVSGVVGAAEELALPQGHYDVVYVANTIHHLADRRRFYEAVLGFLGPDGVMCSWDPVKYNPVINIYRKIASGVRSIDEAPLGRADVADLEQYFDVVEARHFWLTSQILFLKYFLVSRISPNKKRYWKLIYKETESSLWWWLPLRRLDDYLLRLPLLKWLSWNIAIISRRRR